MTAEISGIDVAGFLGQPCVCLTTSCGLPICREAPEPGDEEMSAGKAVSESASDYSDANSVKLEMLILLRKLHKKIRQAEALIELKARKGWLDLEQEAKVSELPKW